MTSSVNEGQIVNHMTVDTLHLVMFFNFAHFVWTLPFQASSLLAKDSGGGKMAHSAQTAESAAALTYILRAVLSGMSAVPAASTLALRAITLLAWHGCKFFNWCF